MKRSISPIVSNKMHAQVLMHNWFARYFQRRWAELVKEANDA